jgi:hypothetical protein
MVNKKGYMKTLEAVFSVILLLIVVVSIVSMNKYEFEEVPNEIKSLQEVILENVQGDETLRGYVYTVNIGLLEDFVDTKIDRIRIDRKVQVCGDITNCEVLNEDEDEVDIYVSSLIIHEEGGNNYLFRLYLWYKPT